MSFNKPAIPTSVGRCADLYHDVRALRLAMSKEVEEVESFERELKEHMLGNLSRSDDTGAAGLRYRVQRVEKQVPRVGTDAEDGGTAEGWTKLWDYIARTGRFDLLQKRLGEKAVKDMWDAGEAVPGVMRMNVPDVSITKI